MVVPSTNASAAPSNVFVVITVAAAWVNPAPRAPAMPPFIAPTNAPFTMQAKAVPVAQVNSASNPNAPIIFS